MSAVVSVLGLLEVEQARLVETVLRKQAAYLRQSAIIPDVTMEWITVSNVSEHAILDILFDRVKWLVPGDLHFVSSFMFPSELLEPQWKLELVVLFRLGQF